MTRQQKTNTTALCTSTTMFYYCRSILCDTYLYFPPSYDPSYKLFVCMECGQFIILFVLHGMLAVSYLELNKRLSTIIEKSLIRNKLQLGLYINLRVWSDLRTPIMLLNFQTQKHSLNCGLHLAPLPPQEAPPVWRAGPLDGVSLNFLSIIILEADVWNTKPHKRTK